MQLAILRFKKVFQSVRWFIAMFITCYSAQAAEAEEFYGTYVNKADNFWFFLTREGRPDEIDVIACERISEGSRLFKGAIYTINVRRDDLYFDPEFEPDDSRNSIIFSKYCVL